MKARLAAPARAGSLAAALALAAFALLGTSGAAPARGMGPLPACRYDDILTSPRAYHEWATTLVDTILRVSSAYVPPDLVDVAEAEIPGKGRVRAVMVEDLRAMTAAAKVAEAPIAVESAYRSYATQEKVFAYWVGVHGRKRALQLSARPGHSEHQLGLAIDFRSAGDGDPFSGDWQLTPQGKWMKAHAWEYGFVMSYPHGRIEVTCYAFEPWHFRYVGRDLAASIHASGLTEREYLWANFTTTVVPPPTPKPPHTAAPTETPPSTVEPSVEPSPAISPRPTLSATTAAPVTPSPSGAPSIPAASEPVPAPTLPPSGDVAAIDPGAAGIALAAGVLAMLLVIVSRKVLRRGRSGLGL
jgi:D-alanyl-D-alanine carboxypeptidase